MEKIKKKIKKKKKGEQIGGRNDGDGVFYVLVACFGERRLCYAGKVQMWKYLEMTLADGIGRTEEDERRSGRREKKGEKWNGENLESGEKWKER